MPIMTFRYRRFLILVIIILAIFVAASNFKWIGRILYPVNYGEYIIDFSEKYDVDPFLVSAIIRVESKYYKDAISHKGARGLMQVAPITGKWACQEIGIDNYSDELLFDPKINIEIGCWYLSKLFKQFNDDTELVIAAYNGGSGNVSKWLKDKRYSVDGEKLDNIPFKETELYVKKVLKSYAIYSRLYEIEDLK
ncbi:soluble lytic murein transglycosylase [Brassicibacter mesophilus]